MARCLLTLLGEIWKDTTSFWKIGVLYGKRTCSSAMAGLHICYFEHVCFCSVCKNSMGNPSPTNQSNKSMNKFSTSELHMRKRNKTYIPNITPYMEQPTIFHCSRLGSFRCSRMTPTWTSPNEIHQTSSMKDSNQVWQVYAGQTCTNSKCKMNFNIIYP